MHAKGKIQYVALDYVFLLQTTPLSYPYAHRVSVLGENVIQLLSTAFEFESIIDGIHQQSWPEKHLISCYFYTARAWAPGAGRRWTRGLRVKGQETGALLPLHSRLNAQFHLRISLMVCYSLCTWLNVSGLPFHSSRSNSGRWDAIDALNY